MGKKLYVGNLGYDVNDADLSQLFGQHGTVGSASVIMDKATGRSKGFGFVEMSSDAGSPGGHRRAERPGSLRPRPDGQRGQASPRRRPQPRRLRRRTPLLGPPCLANRGPPADRWGPFFISDFMGNRSSTMARLGIVQVLRQIRQSIQIQRL